MRKIFFITHSFPYGKGEQFIEQEIKYLAMTLHDTKIILLPQKKRGVQRTLPAAVQLSHKLCLGPTAVLSPVFFASMLYALANLKKEFPSQFCFRNLLKWLNFCFTGRFLQHKLQVLLSREKPHNIILYSYWSDAAAYAVAGIRKKTPEIKAVSRIHGFDLYREVHKNQYMPLESSFLQELDLLCPVSEHGRAYILKNYQVPAAKIQVHRLGVEPGESIAQWHHGNILHVVSCSFLVKVKRIDRLIDALAELENKTPLQIVWSHMGNGPLAKELAHYAQSRLVKTRVHWQGMLQNTQVMEFYSKEKIDIFVNVSASEGVPVSIMEACAFGIPVLACDVGGVAEIVSDKNGALLPKDFSNTLFCDKILEIIDKNSAQFRLMVKSLCDETFNAKNNYSRFAREVLSFPPR